MRSAPADPTRRFSSLPDAPPENAVIVAVPLWPSAKYRTRTWPFCVRASDGSIRPIVVVKVTTLPFCRGARTVDELAVESCVVGVPGYGSCADVTLLDDVGAIPSSGRRHCRAVA